MPKKSSSPPLTELATLAAQAEAATDDFLAQIKAHEAALAAMRINFEVELPEPLDETPIKKHPDKVNGEEVVFYGRYLSHLSYGRVNDTRRIRINQYFERIQTDGSSIKTLSGCKPLLESPRLLQLAAVHALPELLQALKHKLKAHIAGVQKNKSG